MARRSRRSSLAPGFRFHPTDEELVLYYLKRKLTGKSFRFDAIADVDVYKSEPSDLPSKSKLKTRDLEWYFFCVLDKKYGNKLRTNRATERGYWKTTGKDRAVYHGSRVVGMKKTLVYHYGRAPKGERTNWVMHEYRLTDEEFEKSGITQGEKDSFVLCRIFEKSGPGPKNGEKYGAPFIEDEWENDEDTYFPGEEPPVADYLIFSKEEYLDVEDIQQTAADHIVPGNAPPPQNFYYGESSKSVGSSRDVMKDDQKPIRDPFEAASHLHLGGSNKLEDIPEYPVNPVLLPDEPEDDEFFNFDYLLDGPFSDATEYPTSGEGLLIQGNDVPKFDKANGSFVGILDEYLLQSKRNGGILKMGLDSSQTIGKENHIADQAPLSHKPLNEPSMIHSMPNEHILKAYGGDDSSSSTQISEAENTLSGKSAAYIEKASRLLGNIPAPSAYAAEFPSEEAMLKLANATPGFSRLTNFAKHGSETDLLAIENRDNNFVLHGLSQGLGYASLVPLIDMVSIRSGSSLQRRLWHFFFIWVIFIAVGFKVGTFICGR